MIELVIFSKNRAFQLQALLASLRENCDIFDDTTIIYKATNEQFQAGYDKLIASDKAPTTVYRKETIFKQDVLTAADRIPCEYLCFLTDDQICYRKIDTDWNVNAAFRSADTVCHSLRLGRNCRNFPERYILSKEVSLFQWRRQTGTFAYPFSVDGHIFRRDVIRPLLDQIEFENPNKFEACLQSFKPLAPALMSCFDLSLFVGIPTNKVSTTSSCSTTEKFSYSAEDLNKVFLRGMTMDYSRMDFSNIIDTHQTLEFKFKSI